MSYHRSLMKMKRSRCPFRGAIDFSLRLAMTDCCLWLLLMFQPVPVIRPHNVPMQPYMQCVLCSIAWLAVGTNKLWNRRMLFVCLFVVSIDHKNLKLFLLLLLLLCCLFLLIPKIFSDAICCFCCSISIPWFSFSTATLTITSLLSPLCHLSALLQCILEYLQDMESDPDDEVKQSHHHMALLLSVGFTTDAVVNMHVASVFVSVQYLSWNVSPANAVSLLKWAVVAHEWKWQLL